MSGGPAFAAVMHEIWDAEQRNPGCSFQIRANTENHFQVTATVNLDGKLAQCSNILSYVWLDAAQHPAPLLRERLDFMAAAVFEKVEPLR